MKYTVHTAAENGGPFNCRPALSFEIEAKEFICNDIILPWESHPHGMQAWVCYGTFTTYGVVWANNAQDAMDEFCDQGLIIDLMEEFCDQDYDDESLTALGNASELHDLNDVWVSPLAWDNARDCELLCKLAEARGANVDNLDKL